MGCIVPVLLRMKPHLKLVTMFLICLCSCSRHGSITSASVENEINQSLKVGDSGKKIESYLIETKWPYAYNPHLKRYEAAVRNLGAHSSDGHGISVYIYVDGEKRFMLAEAVNFYTGP